MAQQKQIISLRLDLPPLYKEQSDLVNAFDKDPKIRYVVGACGTKAGKLLNIKELIPTPTGWKTMGDIRVGDKVFGENGKPVIVTEVSPITFEKKFYKLTFTDGETVEACAEHLWTVRNYRHGKGRHKEWITMTTEQILQRGVSSQRSNNGYPRYTWQVPTTEPLVYTENDKDVLLPIAPYLFGTFLGDGASKGGVITSADEPILDAWRNGGWEVKYRSKYDYGLTAVGAKHSTTESMPSRLKVLGVYNNKHIPEVYLRASVQQRKDLLAGCLDTDGYCSSKRKNGGAIAIFYNTNKKVIDDVYELAVGLGCRVSVREKEAKIKDKSYGICWCLTIKSTFQLFKLPRKAERYNPAKSLHRSIISIESIESVPGKCIRVDSPSHLYLCGKGCIPTHNTFGAAHRMIRQAINNKNSLNWWVAPVYETSEMAAKLITDMLPRKFYRISHKPTVITLIDPSGATHSEIVFKSAQHEESLRGFPVNFIVADEMARISESAYSAFNTTTTRTRGKILYISTPKGHNLFYDLYQKGNKARLGPNEKDPFPQFYSANLSTYYNPYIPPEDIDEMKSTFTEVMFRQEVMANFLTDASQVFGNYKKCLGGELEEPRPGITYIAGIDLAKTHDYSVICIFNTQNNQLVHFDRFNNLSWTVQRERIKRAVIKYNNALTVVDSNSVGEPNVEELVKDGLIIYPFYINSNQVKRELIERLVVSIEQNVIRYPEIPELLRELEDYELTQSTRGVISYSAPQGKFDDCVVALALCNFFLSNSKQQVYKTSFVRGI